MEPTVWHSRIMSDYQIGDKLGLAAKRFGHEWEPATHIAPPLPPGGLESLMSYTRGEPLPREAFPEALYVFDRKRFEKIGGLFTAGSFYAVKGKLAQVLSQFDLGQGGLIPFPIYQEDKVTLVAGEFYIWKFGAQRGAFLPEQSPKIKPFGFGLNIAKDQWQVRSDVEDGDIALAAASATGPPDVWCDPKLSLSLFFSDALVEALRAAKVDTDFHLRRCRIV
jgi:hypothetical protein